MVHRRLVSAHQLGAVRANPEARLHAAASAAAALIDSTVARDAEEPRNESTPADVEEVGSPPEAEEDFLGDIFGQLHVPNDPKGDGIDVIAVAVVKHLESADIAVSEKA